MPFPELKTQAEIDAESRKTSWWIPVVLGFAIGVWSAGIAAILVG